MLEVHNLYKDFGGLRAIKDVTITIPEGEIIGLIGPNGSGKSTLLNVVSGIMPPTSGQIHFNGHDITNLSAASIFDLGLAKGFQDPSLFFQMTVLDNALLPIKRQLGEQPWYAPWRGFWSDEEHQNTTKAAGVLQEVLLRKHYDKTAAELSGGQMKLLEIARSLMGDPKMLLLDEPTAGVAPNLAYDIFKHIKTLRDELGITFLIVEHRLGILFDFVDSLYVMHMGEILAQGTPDDIIENQDVREVYFGA